MYLLIPCAGRSQIFRLLEPSQIKINISAQFFWLKRKQEDKKLHFK